MDDLSDQFNKHKGLLENLTLTIGDQTQHTVILNLNHREVVTPAKAGEEEIMEEKAVEEAAAEFEHEIL